MSILVPPILSTDFYTHHAQLLCLSYERWTGQQLLSRKSAEPVNRQKRADFMARVTKEGFISDYSGVHISATGKRFRIEQATVWNLIVEKDQYCGQAAVFDQWKYL